MVRVSTADFIKRYGEMADTALAEPVTITKHGKDRLVVVSAAEYGRLRRRDRAAVRAEELSETELNLIASAEPPAGYDHLDAELADTAY
jgi:prevent-host-death family protein